MLVNCAIRGTCIPTRLSRLRSLEVNLVIFGEPRFSTHRAFFITEGCANQWVSEGAPCECPILTRIRSFGARI